MIRLKDVRRYPDTNSIEATEATSAPALGTPASGVLTNCTGTAAGLTAGVASAVAVGGITGLGTGVATALAVNVGSAGAPVTFNGALGTPSSGNLANCTGLTFVPSGTKMLFQQTAAPTGWTKDTTHNDKALRVVSGAASSGGTVAFTTAFASKTPAGTVGGTALTEAQLASHTHTGTTASDGSHTHSVTDPGHTHGFTAVLSQSGNPTDSGGGVAYAGAAAPSGGTSGSAATGISIVAGGAHTHSFTSAAAGSGNTHTHSFTGSAIDLAVQYVDLIIATKD